jgi:hypothetical protein
MITRSNDPIARDGKRLLQLLVFISAVMSLFNYAVVLGSHTICASDNECRQWGDAAAVCDETTSRCDCSDKVKYGGGLCLEESACTTDAECRMTGDDQAVCEGGVCFCAAGYGGPFCNNEGYCSSDADCEKGGDDDAACVSNLCVCTIGDAASFCSLSATHCAASGDLVTTTLDSGECRCSDYVHFGTSSCLEWYLLRRR